MTYYFFMMNYLLMLSFVYYHNFKRFHLVVFLVEGALYQVWNIFSTFITLRPSLWKKNEFDDIFFFHDELSSYPMLSILSQFQKISPWSFLNRGRFIPSLKHFLNFYNIEAFIVKKRIRWHIIFSWWIIFLCYA